MDRETIANLQLATSLHATGLVDSVDAPKNHAKALLLNSNPESVTDAQIAVSMEVIDAMRQHAVRVFPAECCGIVLGRRNERQCVFVESLPGKNIDSARAGSHFQLDWETLLAGVSYLRQGADRCIAFYHSHPDGADDPSVEDAAGAWPGVAMFIIPVRGGVARGPTMWVAARVDRG